MTSVNFWDSEVWSLILLCGVIGLTLLLSSTLTNTIKWLKRSLIPSSVLGGIILLVISTVIFYATGGENGGKYLFELDCFSSATMSGMSALEILTYHCLGLGFVATALRPQEKKFDKKRFGEVFDSGVLTVSGYLIQGIVGLIITILAVKLFNSKVWEGAGIILPFGFGQGTGQAMNYGSLYGNSEQSWGFATVESGRSFGLTVAALGFLAACIGGVIYLNVMRKQGKIKIQEEKEPIIEKEQILSHSETPMSGTIDKMTVQIALVLAVYSVSYLVMEGICSLLNLGESMRATIFGFNFLIGSFLAIGVKSIFSVLHRKNKLKKQFCNTFMLNRIAGFVFDFMVVAGIAAIRINEIREYLGVLLVLGIVGTFVTYFYVNFICKKIFKEYPHQQFLSFYGMLTGTASTGVILLRVIDDGLVSPASDNLVYQQVPAIVFGFPIMFLATYIYTGGTNAPYVTLLLLAVFFVLLQLLLFRRSIFKKKNK